jgi:hypothetical protein
VPINEMSVLVYQIGLLESTRSLLAWALNIAIVLLLAG